MLERLQEALSARRQSHNAIGMSHLSSKCTEKLNEGGQVEIGRAVSEIAGKGKVN